MTTPKNSSKYDLLIVLGGHAVKENGRWRSTHFEEGDQFGCLGDYVRPEAAAILYKKNMRSKIIVSGTKRKKGWPGTVHVQKHELMKLDVPQKQIVTEGPSKNSFWQLYHSQKMLKNKKSW